MNGPTPYQRVARRHREAAESVGRTWTCACVACRHIRKQQAKAAAIKALKKEPEASA